MPDRNEQDILIVEDSATQAEELQYTLEKNGYRVSLARSGAEALAAIRSRRPALVVTDIVMPEMDGFTLCRKVKSKTGPEIPVILLTSLSDPEDVLKGLECGADNFITKPCDPAYLLARIKKVLTGPKPGRKAKSGAVHEFVFGGKKFNIAAEPQQILDVLVSTYETAMIKNNQLQEARNDLERLVEERTAALVVEIDERKKAEQTARTERQRFFDVLETLPVMICLLTTDHQVAFANRAFRDKFGESGGRRCYEYCFHRSEPCEFCESFRVLETGKPYHWEVTFPDRSTVLDAYDLPFIDVDGTPMILEMDIDITERKRTEAELARHRQHLEDLVHERTFELEAFTYSVSHDLRAPLQWITGFSDRLRERYADKLDAKGHDYLRRVQEGVDRMNSLIENLLRLSLLSRQEIVRTDLDVSELVRAIVAKLREANAERKVETSIAEGVRIFADRPLMEVALFNLLGNAWKFSSKKPEARIEFGVFQNAAGQEKIQTDADCRCLAADRGKQGADSGMPGRSGAATTVYYVRDNGAGFNPDYRAKMFRPFQRLHTEQEFEGTGIGLAIVDRIIRHHGGKIWAEGAPDKGATIFFTVGRDSSA